MTSKILKCKRCGKRAQNLMLLALMKDLGVKTSADPLACYDDDGKLGKHEYVEVEE